MSPQHIVLDPTAEAEPARRVRKQPPSTLEGKTVGLLDIGKPRGDIFLDRLEQLLAARSIAVKRYRKPTFTRVAPLALRQEISAACDLVVEALAD